MAGGYGVDNVTHMNAFLAIIGAAPVPDDHFERPAPRAKSLSAADQVSLFGDDIVVVSAAAQIDTDLFSFIRTKSRLLRVNPLLETTQQAPQVQL